jgi:hypothetical protein
MPIYVGEPPRRAERIESIRPIDGTHRDAASGLSVSRRERTPFYTGLKETVRLNVVVSWIVLCIDIFKAKRTDRSDLRDVLTGFRPVEMKSIARQNDYGTGGICLQSIRVEPIA